MWLPQTPHRFKELLIRVGHFVIVLILTFVTCGNAKKNITSEVWQHLWISTENNWIKWKKKNENAFNIGSLNKFQQQNS